MNVLITGGTGYLGRAIVRTLVARGHSPVVFGRTATRSGLPGRPFDGDVRDRAALGEAAAGCDAVCHSAALVSVWRRRRTEFDEVNVGGLENVLAVAEAAGIRRILYTSSFLALPPGGSAGQMLANDYQRTKVLADRVARAAADRGVPIVTVYPGVIYGPGSSTEGNLVGRMISDHLARRLPGIIGARRTWSYAFVDDVAEGHVAALEGGRPGARYVLGGENVPQIRAFEIVSDLTGRPLPRRIPSPAARLIALEEVIRARLLGGTPLLTPGTVRILEADWPLDSEVATREIGYRCRPLAAGIAATLAAMGAAEPRS